MSDDIRSAFSDYADKQRAANAAVPADVRAAQAADAAHQAAEAARAKRNWPISEEIRSHLKAISTIPGAPPFHAQLESTPYDNVIVSMQGAAPSSEQLIFSIRDDNVSAMMTTRVGIPHTVPLPPPVQFGSTNEPNRDWVEGVVGAWLRARHAEGV